MANYMAYCLINSVVWKVWTWEEFSDTVYPKIADKPFEQVFEEVRQRIWEITTPDERPSDKEIRQKLRDIIDDLGRASGDMCTADETASYIIEALADLYL